MEELRSRRAVRDADVLLRCELEEPLETRARVLGAVALVPVREQEPQTRRLAPLRATGDDELVDDDLGAVDEVAELGLPEHQRVRRGDRVAVLEGERRVLGQRRVVDLEGRVRLGQRLERGERLPGHRVVQDGVAVREGPALRVLTGEPDRDPLLEQRGECERLGLAPVDPALGDRLAAPLELLGELRIHLEAFGNEQQLVVQLDAGAPPAPR